MEFNMNLIHLGLPPYCFQIMMMFQSVIKVQRSQYVSLRVHFKDMMDPGTSLIRSMRHVVSPYLT